MKAGIDLLDREAAEAKPSNADSLYERDFARWALREAVLIRSGRLGDLDTNHIAEEIESLGREQFGNVRGHFRVVLLHLLKWDFQPESRTRSWTLSIREARMRVEDTIESSPSLKRRRQEALARAYQGARVRAALETDLPLSAFPEACPYSLDDVINRRIAWHDD